MNTTALYMNALIVTIKTATSGIWSHTDSNTVILLTICAVPVDRDSSTTRNYEGIEMIPKSVQDRKEVPPQKFEWHYLWKH